jgi:Na+(H+)/acetate symporter ActP
VSTPALVALIAIVLVGLATAAIGSFGVRMTRRTSDFLVAQRTVGPVSNAGAISGEYLSAAAYLGMTGLILREGADGLWYPVAFATGFLALLLFVAAPLRRSGAYTVPDFAEGRLLSVGLRRLCTAFVLIIGWLYLLPQLQGAGLALTALTPLPAWMGVAAAGVVVLLTVVGGGMRSITFVQAFQYWLKLTAIAVPAVVVLGLFLAGGKSFDHPSGPLFPADTTVAIRTDVLLEVAEPTRLEATGLLDGQSVRGGVLWQPGRHEVARGSSLSFTAGTAVPMVAGSPTTDRSWLQPLSGGDEGEQLLEIYSILLAGALGTMGLPHVLVRFYSNPDGRTARRTTVGVLAMVGAFFAIVALVGALSRLYTPQLLISGQSDAAVLLMPSSALGSGWLGWLLGGLVAAGAGAAFLSASSGLLVSLAGVLFTDVLPGRLRHLQLAALLAVLPPFVLALTVPRLDFAVAVPMVFAVAASTFCPLLVLGIWWRGLTAAGAAAGVLVGGGLCVGSIAIGMVGSMQGWIEVLLLRPAAVTVPLAFAVMVAVSKLTRKRIPPGADAALLRLHAPERLGLSPGRLQRPGPRT